MATCERTRVSCGVYDLVGLGDTSPDLLKKVMERYVQQAAAQGRIYGFGQICFSDADINGHGERFFKYLKRTFPKSEGVLLRVARSPSTGRKITTYLWNIPHVKFREHAFLSRFAQRSGGSTVSAGGVRSSGKRSLMISLVNTGVRRAMSQHHNPAAKALQRMLQENAAEHKDSLNRIHEQLGILKGVCTEVSNFVERGNVGEASRALADLYVEMERVRTHICVLANGTQG